MLAAGIGNIHGKYPANWPGLSFETLAAVKEKVGDMPPVSYTHLFDLFYNSELFLRAHGTYSIKITDPLKFYAEAIPKNQDQVEIDSINEQYLAEFLEALQR